MSGLGHIVSRVVPKVAFTSHYSDVRRSCMRCLSLHTNHHAWSSSEAFKYRPDAVAHFQVRHMSGQKNFFKEFVDSVKQEMNKNKEMKDNLRKFREEADKLEQSEALQKAREKYQTIESETARSTETLKKTFSSLQDKMKETLEEVEKTDVAKRGKHMAEEFGKTAQRTAESVSRGGEQLSKSPIFKSVSEGVRAVKDEIGETALSRGRPYRAPEKLRMRDDSTLKSSEDRTVEANPDATGVTLHKDSRWYQSWQTFKDNNQFVTKMFDMKMKYDESEHVLVRATRTFTDKMSGVFGGMFSKTEMSEVLTEIVKMDPTFDREKFILECQRELIPNILEAIVRGELHILKDWCHEAAYNMLAHPIEQAKKAGYIIQSRVLDINNVDIAAGKMMEQGPVLVFSFHAQQVMVVRDQKGKVVEGDPEKILRIFYVWAFCRDQTVLDPKAAWRLIDLSSSPMEQFL